MAGGKVDLGSLRTGIVIGLDDRVTGFDLNKENRPYVIVRTSGGSPPTEIFVVPRSASAKSGGVETPAGVVPGLNADGRFLVRPYRLSGDDLNEILRVLGPLPERYLAAVLENTNFVEFE